MSRNAILLCFFVCMSYSFDVCAQCPSSMSASAVTTDAGCPSSGSVIINTIPAASASFTYKLTAGPSGALLNVPQSSNIFNALLPGNYTASADCGATHATVLFTINNTYTPITDVGTTVSLNCGSFAQGGSVSISVTGGKAPFLYSIIKSNDPNYADAASAYSSSANKTVSSNGTYQVRVKDACNQFYTVTTQLNSLLSPVSVTPSTINPTSCSSSTLDFVVNFYLEGTSTFVDFPGYNALGGIKVNVFEKDAAGCAPTGPLLISFIAHANYYADTFHVIKTSSKQYFWQAITPCGDTVAQCIDASGAESPYYSMAASVTGCGTGADPLIETITSDSYAPGIVYPLIVKLYAGTDASGILTATKTANTAGDIASLSFTGLTPAAYFIQSTDACGHVNTQIIDNPTAAGAPNLASYYFATNTCTGAGISTQSGTATVVFIIHGFLPNASSATAVITSGPGSIGDPVFIAGNDFIWSNLLPGTYTAAVTTSCGTTNLQFVVPNSPANLLKQNITATGASTCGSGSGTVTAATDYNGALVPNYVLVNATSNTGVDSNATGIFTNVAPGQYYVRLKLINNTWCSNTTGYYVNSNTTTVAPSGVAPQVTKQLGVVCEDINGNQLTTGTAYLSIAGASPLLVEYKPIASATWITYSTNASAETSIPDLAAGNIYDVRVTSCGITTATQIAIGQLTKIHTTTSLQPCNGNPYELTLPQLSGAVYQWINPSGIVVSTSYNYTIPSFSNSYNGSYTGILTWSGCVKRSDTVILNSASCGTILVLPVKLSSFTGAVQNCAVSLQWKIETADNIKGFGIERSAGGNAYSNIGNVMAAEGNAYAFTDKELQQGIVYYRLKMTGHDGHYEYSNITTVNSRCNNATTQWSVYPSLVQQGKSVCVKLYSTDAKTSSARITVTSVTGQQLYAGNVVVQAGQNTYTLPENKLVPGTCLVFMYDNKGQRIGDVQKLVYAR